MNHSGRPRIFIVHGRDLLACETVAHVLRKLDVEPVFLTDAVLPGQTWLECLETSTQGVSTAVVIYRADDVGYLVSERTHPRLRARQNVLFELGFMIGKLGRTNVCVLHEEGVEIPTDYAGARVVALGPGWEWKVQLAFALKAAGVPVDPARLVNAGIGGAPPDQEILRDSAQRTRRVIDDLNDLATQDERGAVRFSGFLSIFAVGEREMNERQDGELLRAERDALLRMARRRTEIYCIITPPTQATGKDPRTTLAHSRLKTLHEFMQGSDEALKNIYWAIAPRIENYIYIIGQRSFVQGFRGDDPERGFSITERRTDENELSRQTRIYKERFESHEGDSLKSSGITWSGERVVDLRRAAEHALTLAMNRITPSSPRARGPSGKL